MYKLFGTVFVGAGILASSLSIAAAQDGDHPRADAKIEAHRYYDATHKDYHVWDAKEDRAYHAYVTDQHRDYVEWNTLKPHDRQAYWDWRHAHPEVVVKP